MLNISHVNKAWQRELDPQPHRIIQHHRLQAMRLLNTKTLKLEEFNDQNRPEYAILSHTWAAEEVTFQDIQTLPKREFHERLGWIKIAKFCARAKKCNYDYGWVDTCCIDKSSSAELSEAINSMYRWYAEAAICITFLEDVHQCPQTSVYKSFQKEFRDSRWFTRGWCLQELIAPRSLHFFNADWKHVGTKMTLSTLITTATGVDETGLFGLDLQSISVARRMSWAAKRQTTRPEDIAYCLLGIFNVHMPLLYGEGGQAFIRLQEEIIRQSDDQTIFAWSNAPTHDPWIKHGLLASHPSAFAASATLQRRHTDSPPWAITNKGVQISLALIKMSSLDSAFTAILDCIDGSDPGNVIGFPVFPLKKGGNIWARLEGFQKIPLKTAEIMKKQQLFMLKTSLKQVPDAPDCSRCWLRAVDAPRYKLTCAVPRTQWDLRGRVLTIVNRWTTSDVAVGFVGEEGTGFAVVMILEPELEDGRIFLVPLESGVDETALKTAIEECTRHASYTALVPNPVLNLGAGSAYATLKVAPVQGTRSYVVDVWLVPDEESAK